ncbi:hypothetical protein GQ44DRAFT_725725 [Phaeosphaeriaceae sp. PMI808]|nr:hypothetical protein GQ44DRAFT_725725 [Phaeosphaeriaceae sp. PMI808]
MTFGQASVLFLQAELNFAAKRPVPFTSIIWPLDFWKAIDVKQTAIAKKFAKQIKTSLDAEFAEISFDDVWLKSPPSEAESTSLPEFIDEACKNNSKLIDGHNDIQGL